MATDIKYRNSEEQFYRHYSRCTVLDPSGLQPALSKCRLSQEQNGFKIQKVGLSNRKITSYELASNLKCLVTKSLQMIVSTNDIT